MAVHNCNDSKCGKIIKPSSYKKSLDYCNENHLKRDRRRLLSSDLAKNFTGIINYRKLAQKLDCNNDELAEYAFLFGLRKQLQINADRNESAKVVIRNICYNKNHYKKLVQPLVVRTGSNNVSVNDILSGGLSDFKTVEEIANRHNKTVDEIDKQLATGIQVEKEHTDNPQTAAEIAKDHLWERPDYYIVLSKVENMPVVEKLETGGPVEDKNFNNPVYAELVAADSDLDKVVKAQDLMKKANAIIKSNKDVETRLKNELALSEKNIYTLINPDRYGRTGFASYQLTNNNANIKRLRERVAMLTKKYNALKSDKKEAYTFTGGRIEVNYPLDRVQIFFDEKPDADTRTKMKSSGWKWAPSEGAWQRKNTPDALFSAKHMFSAVGDADNTVIETVAPVRTYTVDDITDRNFSLVNMSVSKAYTKQVPDDEVAKKALNNFEARLIVFSSDRDVVKATIKAYLEKHMPDLDFSKVSISAYPQTYVNDAKKLLAAGFYLPKPDTASPGKTLFPLYNNYRFLEDYVSETPEVEPVIEKNPDPETSTIKIEETQEPNSPEEFDQSILEQVDAPHEWVGNLIKERVVKGQIYKLLSGPEEEKRKEVERLFFKFAKQQYPEYKIHEMHQPKTLGKISSGAVIEYADIEGDIIQELERQGDLTTSDAQGILMAHENIAREKYGLGFDADQIAKAILEKSASPTPTHSEIHSSTDFQGINYAYKNQYVLNKAIEALLQQKGISSSDYSSDEKAFIRKYSGYGGLDKYGKTGKGGLFEYYTATDVIKKMWALAYKFGYNNGSVLEPSVGTGEFLQFLKPGIRCVAYDISSVSAQICKILYPHVEVITQPFEQIFINKNWTIKDKTDDLEKFDLVIGNPPYGDFSIVESRYMSGMGEKDHVKPNNYVEYFLRRGVDLLKPGGLLIFIVGAQLKNGGTLFLDSGASTVKDYLQQNCELLDAYRLPDSIFERTGVTSDIIVLKKM